MAKVREITAEDGYCFAGVIVNGHFLPTPIPTPTEALASYAALCIERDRLAGLSDAAQSDAARALALLHEASSDRDNAQSILHAAIMYEEWKNSGGTGDE